MNIHVSNSDHYYTIQRKYVCGTSLMVVTCLHPELSFLLRRRPTLLKTLLLLSMKSLSKTNTSGTMVQVKTITFYPHPSSTGRMWACLRAELQRRVLGTLQTRVWMLCQRLCKDSRWKEEGRERRSKWMLIFRISDCGKSRP